MPSDEPEDIRCPLCHARLVTTDRGWRCARWGPKLGRCRFSVYRHINSRSLSIEDLRLLCSEGILPWPHTDGRTGWVVLDRNATDGCRFTDVEPSSRPRARSIFESWRR